MKKRIVLLHNEVLTDQPDEVDVIHQRDLVQKACEQLGYEVQCLTVGRNLSEDLAKVEQAKADLVFNLVEATWGKGELIYFVPAILNALKIPYTGVPLDALFLTTNKVLAKKFMGLYGIPTAPYFAVNELNGLDPAKTYIVKPIWEEASVGITDGSIFKASDSNKVREIGQLPVSHYFVEEFIEGREFNVSILGGAEKPEVLPAAEMIFSNYFDGKPKFVGYKAKWDENSEEYHHTNRAFNTLSQSPELQAGLEEICLKCWNAFHLKGYVRVDFRVNQQNQIFVLEINGNPCIAPDSGFVAALEYAGYTQEVLIERILKELN